MFHFVPIQVLCLFQVFWFSSLNGQPFNEVNPGLFKPSDLGYTSWCDINNDGYQDVFVTGFNLVPNGSGGYIDFIHSMIYINDQHGSFRQSTVTNIPRAIYGSSAWGDFNNDGWADLVVTGTVSGFATNNISHLYINNQNETFTRSVIQLLPMSASETIWFDYDNDGWQDLFMMGVDFTNTMVIKVMRNDKGNNLQESGIVFDVKQGGYVNLGGHDAVIGDFDNDNDPDIILSQTSSGGFSTDVYENTGGSFTKRTTTITQTSYATLAVADFNADGNLDVAINGIDRGSQSETYAGSAYFKVYRGDGNLNFFEVANFPNDGSYWGSITAGDLNNDGLPDIVINGTGNGSPRTTVFLNSGGTAFIKQSYGMVGTLIGESTLCDYDNDGDLDIFVIGSTTGSASDAQARLYRNDISKKNNPPSVPGNVKVKIENGKPVIVWDASTDDTTPQKAISYNISVGSAPNATDILSGMSNATALRQVDQHGNTYFNLSRVLNNIDTDEKFYFQVQAVDAAYHESAFSPLQLGCVTPPPTVDFKSHYCYNENVVVTATGTQIEIYEDAALSTLVHAGASFSTPAVTGRTLYIVDRGAPECVSIPAVVQYTVSEEPSVQFYGNEKLIDGHATAFNRCNQDDVLTIRAESNYSNITWPEAGTAGNMITVDESKQLLVVVEDEHGCQAESTLAVQVNTYADLFIPNVITPNGDGDNDRFILNSPGRIDVAILNRFGSRVFYASDYKDNFSGTDLSSGVYFYSVQQKGCDETKKGPLHIIR